MERALLAACDLRITKTLKQHWTQDRFSYLSRPRPDHGLMLLLAGRIDFVTSSMTLHAQAGDVVFLPKGCRYEAVFRQAFGTIDNYLVNFDSVSLDVNAAAPCLLSKNASADCAEHFHHLVAEHRMHTLSPLRERGLLLLLLDAVLHAPDAPGSNVLEQACTLLKETEFSVRDIARRCSVSESSLRALFQEKLHTSPIRLRLQARLERAAYLLESTSLTVAEIAEKARFYDAAAFCRLFKRHFGKTPREYARSKRL